MSIEDITIRELREFKSLIGDNSKKEVPFEIGKDYFIRTVTYHTTGKVVDIVGSFLVLEDAAWIADSGRFHNALKSGVVDESEPFVRCAFINIETIVDATPWEFKLITEQK
jgi:hypothetical protein